PIAQKAVQLFTKPIPRVISPRAHFALDYISAGVLLASTVALWPRNRRAALGAAICGVADLATATLTSRPGGARRPFSFRTHVRRDHNGSSWLRLHLTQRRAKPLTHNPVWPLN